jgi:hypothetical protein
MNRNHFPILCLFAFFNCIIAKGKTFNPSAVNSGLYFIENKGQITDQYYKTRSDIQFAFSSKGVNVFIGRGELHYQFTKNLSQAKLWDVLKKPPTNTEDTVTTFRIDLKLLGANTRALVVTDLKQDYFETYYTAGTSNEGATVNTFGKITYENIYPHIDWTLSFKDGELKHEFIVHPGGNVSDIKLRYDGADSIRISLDGALQIKNSVGSIVEAKPYSFQMADNKEVKTSYQLEGSVIRYAIDPFIGTVVIDPSISWATYYGGSNTDYAVQPLFDSLGNIYVSGTSMSTTTIATVGAFQTTFAGGLEDMFLAKFSNSGTRLWSTYYGGTGTDKAGPIAIDTSGYIYLVGYTWSSGLATPMSYQATISGGWDGILAKFSSTGLRQWATYYGGVDDDYANGLAADRFGNLYIAGYTRSTTGIATAGAFQPIFAGGSGYGDAFIAKFNSAGVVRWGTYFGGSADENNVGDVATDKQGNVYLTATTESTSGIATPGAHQMTHAGGIDDVFLAKFDSTGYRIWATYFGGENYDSHSKVFADSANNVYLAAGTMSISGIATPSSFQPVYGGGVADAFLAKFNGTGVLQWATYFGGTENDSYDCGYVDNAGNIIIAGHTMSSSGIASPGAFQSTMHGMFDTYIAKFDQLGGRIWASYYGGDGGEYSMGVCANSAGDICLAGETNGTIGIATSGAFHTTFGGGSFDGFLLKLDSCDRYVSGIMGADHVCFEDTIMLSDSTPGGAWSSQFGKVLISSTGVVAGYAPGVDTVRYTVYKCGIPIIAKKAITVYSASAGTISGNSSVCQGDTIHLYNSTSIGVWYSSNSSASVASDGEVTGLSVGYDTILFVCANPCGTDTAEFPITIISSLGCNTLTAETSKTGCYVDIYPNPTSGAVVVRLQSSFQDYAEITVCNILGQKGEHFEVNANSSTPIFIKQNGIYLIEVKTRFGIERKKVIVE